MESYRIKRKNAVTLSSALQEYLLETHLSSGMNTRRIFAAWDEVSGAGHITLKRFYRNGTLYITLNSSVARSQLQFSKDALVERINDRLYRDEFFCKDDPKVSWVKEIVLK